MWIEIKQTKEWIPFDAEHTTKVFRDGEKGWAIKQKDGTVYHVSDEQYENKMLRELDSDMFWKKRQLEDATRGLDGDELKQIRKMLEKHHHHHEKKEEED